MSLNPTSTDNKGLTIIEILISLAIIGVLVTIVTLTFSKLNDNLAVNKSVDIVISVLDEARAITLSGKGALQYGVHFEDTQVVLFQGSSYSASDPTNLVTPLNFRVGLRNIALSGGGVNTVFERLTGSTLEPGTLEIYLRSAPTTFRTIIIESTGIAQEDD